MWSDGDQIRLELPMRVDVKRWSGNKNSASVRRGPLWFSLRIDEHMVRYTRDDNFPAWEVYPTAPWNYGLVLDDPPESSFKEELHLPEGTRPWTTGDSPVRLWATGRRVPQWQQDRTGLVRALQPSPVRSGETDQPIMLIPMGAARLRISAFPVIGSGPDAHEWAPPVPVRHAASYEHDDIEAVSDGKEPKDSNDHSIPRFTWWDHLGTAEWITYRFGKARPVSSCSVYWFDDTGVGRCRVPASWKVLYRDGEAWKDVAGVSGCEVERDGYNRAGFNPVTTSELRLEVRLQDGFSGGILEWKVGD